MMGTIRRGRGAPCRGRRYARNLDDRHESIIAVEQDESLLCPEVVRSEQEDGRPHLRDLGIVELLQAHVGENRGFVSAATL